MCSYFLPKYTGLLRSAAYYGKLRSRRGLSRFQNRAVWYEGINMRSLGLVGRAVTGVRIRRVVRPNLVLKEIYSCFLRKCTGLQRYYALGPPRGEQRMRVAPHLVFQIIFYDGMQVFHDIMP